ncbi:hypothetical protein P3W85_13470 [Cupriavidus basilensis]|uniref:Uncharacterized protein n=1 Tax=Cupriavidus basilensis TaxID=68895 RepID=A0ABT6AMW2_9BURK|nr:hypothetical protein [Cupriavidus basilensis]MDF3833954.1 hypothetical protein [Cupriavidus basilensis]
MLGGLLAGLAAILSPIALAAPATPAGAPLALRVEHQLSSLGSDGVKRDVAFAERVYRAGNAVWIERELPRGVPHEHEQESGKGGGGHKHVDLSTAARWIENPPSGKLSVTVVSDHLKKVFDVKPAEYGNIGFDGSWPTAYHLLDPAALKQMRAVGPLRNGAQQYQAQRGGESVTVWWDVAGQFPRSVESRNAGGTSTKLTRVTTVATPQRAPWERARAYARGEYTDLMD